MTAMDDDEVIMTIAGTEYIGVWKKRGVTYRRGLYTIVQEYYARENA